MRSGQKVEATNCFRGRSLRVRRNICRLTRHTPTSSVATEVVQIHHSMRLATKADMNAMEICVEMFEIVKQKSNRAMKKGIVLAAGNGSINLAQGVTLRRWEWRMTISTMPTEG